MGKRNNSWNLGRCCICAPQNLLMLGIKIPWVALASQWLTIDTRTRLLKCYNIVYFSVSWLQKFTAFTEELKLSPLAFDNVVYYLCYCQGYRLTTQGKSIFKMGWKQVTSTARGKLLSTMEMDMDSSESQEISSSAVSQGQRLFRRVVWSSSLFPYFL